MNGRADFEADPLSYVPESDDSQICFAYDEITDRF